MLSLKTFPRYAPRRPIEQIIKPDSNQIELIKLAQPETGIPYTSFFIIMYIEKVKLMIEINNPILILSNKGLVDEYNIESKAKFTNLEKLYEEESRLLGS